MTDLENFVRRAVASPIADPSDLETIQARAARRRSQRRTAWIAGGLGLVLMSAGGVATLVRDDQPTPRVAVQPSTTSSAPDAAYTTGDLIHDLNAAAKHATPHGTVPGSPFAVDAQLLCVDRTDVRVYEYPTVAARLAVSNTISRDGSAVGDARSGRTIVEWVGPPHFFARGRIIVLALSDDASLLDALDRVLGPTLSPLALRHPLAVTTRCTANG